MKACEQVLVKVHKILVKHFFKKNCSQLKLNEKAYRIISRITVQKLYVDTLVYIFTDVSIHFLWICKAHNDQGCIVRKFFEEDFDVGQSHFVKISCFFKVYNYVKINEKMHHQIILNTAVQKPRTRKFSYL